MSDGAFRSTRALKREISPDGGGKLFATLIGLWPYIWPSSRRDLKIRVLIAMVLLLLAKLATIAVPFTFKWATDALTGQGSAPVAPSAWLGWALPVRWALGRGDRRHDGLLHVLHVSRHRVAHQHPPPDERERHRCQGEGDRLAAKLRDREVFRRRGARGEPLRPLHGALRARER